MEHRSNLYYCYFFDNRNQQTVLDREGQRLCLLINSKDFASFLHIGITILVSAHFHGDFNHFDDRDISHNYARSLARENAKKLLAIFSQP